MMSEPADPYLPPPDEGAAYAQAVKDAKGPAPTFKVWTPAEIWAPIEEPDYLFGGLLVRGSLGLVVAYGASLKTWTTIDGWLSVGTGTPWLGRFPTKQGRALLFDFESGPYELRRRAHRLARGRELAIPVEGCGFVTMPAMSLAEDAFFEALAPLAKEHAFIGIDSLAAGSAGIDENDSRFATSLQRLKAIAAETGCVIVVLHHSRKGNGEGSDEREMVRGSSAIFNAADVVLQLVRAKDDGAFLMRQSKARGGKAVEPFVVRVDDVSADASVVVASDAPEPGDDGECLNRAKAIDKAKRAILLLLGQERGLTSKNKVYIRIGGSKGDKVSALAELINDDRTVVEHEGAWRLASEVTK